MRLFLGLPVEGRAFEEVGEKVGLIKGNGWQVKWSKPENLNLTMAFIGEVDDVGVIRVLENMVRQNPIPKKMILEFEGFGVFNNYSQPRVLTLAIGKSEKLFEYRNGLI